MTRWSSTVCFLSLSSWLESVFFFAISVSDRQLPFLWLTDKQIIVLIPFGSSAITAVNIIKQWLHLTWGFPLSAVPPVPVASARRSGEIHDPRLQHSNALGKFKARYQITRWEGCCPMFDFARTFRCQRAGTLDIVDQRFVARLWYLTSSRNLEIWFKRG